MSKVKVMRVIEAFGVWPQTVYALESMGTLPKRPRGWVTRSWVNSLVTWYEHARGPIPDAAQRLIKDAIDGERGLMTSEAGGGR